MPTFDMLNKNYYSHCPLKKRPIKKGEKILILLKIKKISSALKIDQRSTSNLFKSESFKKDGPKK